MRYVMRIAEFSESSNLWTQIALLGSPRSTPLSVSVQPSLSSVIGMYFSIACWLDNESLSMYLFSLLKYMEWNRTCDQFFSSERIVSGRLLLHSDVNIKDFGLFTFYVYLSASAITSLSVANVCIGSVYGRTPYDFSLSLPKRKSEFWSEMKRDNPLNLSILIRGGKETNKDSPSNGEWSGKSSIWKSTT